MIKSDVDFLAGLGFMDYSLLIGIEVLSGEDLEKYGNDVHQIGAPRTPTRKRLSQINESVNMDFSEDIFGVDIDEERIDVGERMSLKHCFVSGNRVYHISLIDFLQEWNLNKRGERFMKTVLMGKDGPTLSALEPNEYAVRFKKFCEQHVFKP